MKLLLKENVKNLGVAGEVVEVKDGFGRNYLVPQQFAVEVTAGNLNAIELEKKRLVSLQSAKIEKLQEVMERIGGVDITISANVSEGENLYGAVQPKEIVDALKVEGIEIEVDAIEIETPIKTLGVHRVPVKLHPEVKGELKLWVVENKEGETAE